MQGRARTPSASWRFGGGAARHARAACTCARQCGAAMPTHLEGQVGNAALQVAGNGGPWSRGTLRWVDLRDGSLGTSSR